MTAQLIHRACSLLIVPFLFAVQGASGQVSDPKSIWAAFKSDLLGGAITAERIRPYYPPLTQPMLEFLNALRGQVPAEQWDREPEVHQVGRLYHYILPFVEGSDTSVFNFTITVDDTAWFFTHLENIVIRLDRISELPATSFPDIAQEQKAWMREEIYWSFIVHLYRTLSRDKGSSFVLDLLRDGSGFALAAKTWVPFVPQKRAFVLYLCWEQANLRGNTVSLDTLTDTLAIVTLTPTYLLLHKRTAHLKNQISLQDYRRIFETIWQDRARAAGWNLTIAFPNDEQCIFTLR